MTIHIRLTEGQRRRAERNARWVERYLLGESPAAIAASAGVSRQYVHRVVTDILRETGRSEEIRGRLTPRT